MDVAGRRKTVPGHIYKLEQNLEARREAAEWLEEGEDEESVAGAYGLIMHRRSILCSCKTSSQEAEDEGGHDPAAATTPRDHRDLQYRRVKPIRARLCECIHRFALEGGSLIGNSRHLRSSRELNERRLSETRLQVFRPEIHSSLGM